jgi:electron transport complex protein RnfG
MMKSSISRNSLLLALFAVVTTIIISGTYLSTRERVVAEQRKAKERALLEIIAPESHDNSMLDDTLMVGPEASGLNLRRQKEIFIARRNEAAVAVILPAIAPDGYSGEIELIVGINADGTIAGSRVLAHRETPGLGDKVDIKKSNWILGFDGRSLQNPKADRWKVKKDQGVFDQFTGATITPRAVTAAVKRSLDYFEKNRERLLAPREKDNG